MPAPRDDDERPQAKKPRPPRPPGDEGIRPAKSRSPAPAPDNWEDEPEERPRRHRNRPDDVERGDDGVSTIIPYRNGMALAAYYVGVFSLIPVFGLILGPLGIIFGVVGVRNANRNPEIKGTGHAIAGIVLGGIATLGNYGFVLLIILGAWVR
jgi:hypothetical protein